MDFFQRASGVPSRLGILAGTFNPVTVAHLALARAARRAVDELVFVLPRAFPHKPYGGASFDERLSMLRVLLHPDSGVSIAASDGGLFSEIGAECRSAYGPETRLTFVCGRDAAERIATWDYGSPEAFDAMLRQFDLLVAARAGEYLPPEKWRSAMEPLPLDGPFDHVSATEVRERITRGDPWQHLVPPAVHAQVKAIYR